MRMFAILAFCVLLALAAAVAAEVPMSADPGRGAVTRPLPGPIVNGRQRQPTRAEIMQRRALFGEPQTDTVQDHRREAELEGNPPVSAAL